MKVFNKIFNKDNVAIEKFRDKEDRLITYKELLKIPMGKTVQILEDSPGDIECTRIKSTDENSIMFTVTMKKGKVWEKHHHDCHEICVVYRGELVDEIGDRVAKSAQLLNFKPNQPHYVVAKEDSIFYVEFKRGNM